MKFNISIQNERRGVKTIVGLWSIIMAIVLPLEIARSSPAVTWTGFISTGVVGLLLGARGRGGVVSALPITSWLFSCIPMVCASMIHTGVVKGFFVGVFLVTLGYVPIAFLQILVAGLCAFVASRLVPRRKVDIVITPPTRPQS